MPIDFSIMFVHFCILIIFKQNKQTNTIEKNISFFHFSL